MNQEAKVQEAIIKALSGIIGKEPTEEEIDFANKVVKAFLLSDKDNGGFIDSHFSVQQDKEDPTKFIFKYSFGVPE
jgi:predicted Zn-dependent peptidase